MNKMFMLTKVMLKTNIEFNKKTIALVAVVALSMMPLMFLVWQIVWQAYDAMASIGQQGLVLWLAVSMVSLITFAFGIFYIMGVFFYSNDIEILLPLPLKPWQILGAKFATVLAYEYLTQLVFLLPVLAAYGVKERANITYIVLGLMAYFILPIVPLVFASIIDILVMRSFKFVKNKDRMKIISGVIAMIIAIGFNFLVQNIVQGQSTPEEMMRLIQQGNNSVLGKIQDVFIVNRFMTLSLANYRDFLYSASNMLLATVGVGIFLAIFLYSGERFYLKGVVGLTQASSVRIKTVRGILYKRRSHLLAFIIKELKILYRTPVYFLNCVLMNFLWPVFILIPVFTKGGNIGELRSAIQYLSNPDLLKYAVAGVASAAIFISGTNMISSTAISREGKNLYVSRYMPVDYKTVINAKVISGIFMSFAGILAGITVVWILFYLPINMVLMALLISLPCSVSINYLAILLDLKFPKLNWDDEQKAVKQNMNGVLIMFISMALGFLNFLPPLLLNLSFKETLFGIVIFYLIADILIYKAVTHYGIKWFHNIQ